MAAISQCHRLLSRDHRILTAIVLDDDEINTMSNSFHKESQQCKVSC
jgi:hypothetical protein